MKKSRGPGTLSLLLFLVATLVWSSYINGTSVVQMIGNFIGFTDSTILTLCVLFITIPGIILGIARHRDWGAKFGAVACFAMTCYILFPLAQAALR
jgi:hypothetical protein